MKKVVVTAKMQDFAKIKPILEGTSHFIDKKNGIVRIDIYIPDEGLDDLISGLEEAIDFRYCESMIEVLTPDFIISSALKRSEKKAAKAEERTPVEKLLDSIKPYQKLDASKIALTSVAGIIALSGLFLNNVAIIIGAMLLSPLLGPIYAFAINTAVGRPRDALKSIGNLAILLLMVIIFSYLATLFISPFISLSLTPEILSRMELNSIYILMAVLLGFASVLAISRGISESVAGVAIAAALLPPAVVSGISLVLYPHGAMHSLILTFENVLGLMAGSLAATVILDIGPRKYYERVKARRFIRRTCFIILLILVLLLVFSVLLVEYF